MRITYTTPNGRVRFEFEAQTAKQTFELLGRIAEVFEEPNCGACGKANIRCSVREHQGNMYYKWVCPDCGAQLDLGQHKDGKGMFAKRTESP